MFVLLTKQEKIDNFRQWAIAHDVQFVEHPNGHFRIFVGGDKLMDVWVTTERAKMITGDTIMGINYIQKSITTHIDKYYM